MASATDARYAIPGFISILVVLGIFAVGKPNFEALRPSAEEKIDYSESGFNRIEARLWQDPFNAVEAYDESIRANKTGQVAFADMLRDLVSDLRRRPDSRAATVAGEAPAREAALHGREKERLDVLLQLLDCLENATSGEVVKTGKVECPKSLPGLRLDLGDYARSLLEAQLNGELHDSMDAGARVFLLPVTLPVGDYADLIERRRRSRYAVVGALTQQGFLPTDSEHLRVLRMPQALCVDQAADSDCQTSSIPYEYFEKKASDANEADALAVVLWVEDRDLKQSLLPLVSSVSAAVDGPGPIPSFLLGPYSSSHLSTTATPPDNVKVVNWSATNRPDASASRWTNTISTDKQLLRALAEKVDARVRGSWSAENHGDKRCAEVPDTGSPAGTENGKTVLLISEGDTGYATSLYQFAKACFLSRGYEVLARSYIRGIDGQYPGHTPQQPKNRESRDGQSVTENLLAAGYVERSSGTSQFDYLRRLAKRLGSERQRIDAVGVLGSDPYDKVLVLQALRAEYPRAVYFTTDLYSLFLREDSAHTYSNLLVAASHDLRPLTPASLTPAPPPAAAATASDTPGLANEGLDQMTRSGPPLRDSYQSSLYEAVMLASSAMITNNTSTLDSHKAQVRLFEIGRGKVFELRTPSIDEANGRPTITVTSRWRVSFALVNLLAVFFVLLVACYQSLVYLTAGSARTAVREKLARRALKLSASLCIAAVAIIALLWKFTTWLGSRPVWDFAPDTGEQTMALAVLILACSACLGFVALRPAEMLSASTDPATASPTQEPEQRDTQLRALISLTILAGFVVGYLIIWCLPVVIGARVGELWSLTAGVSAWPPFALAVVIILLCGVSYGFVRKRRQFLAEDLYQRFDLASACAEAPDPEVLHELKRYHRFLSGADRRGPFDLGNYPLYAALLVFTFVLISIVENGGTLMLSLSFRGGAGMIDLAQLAVVICVGLFCAGLFLVGRESRKMLDVIRWQPKQSAGARIEEDAQWLRGLPAKGIESSPGPLPGDDTALTLHAVAYFDHLPGPAVSFRYQRFPNSVRNSLVDIELVELITMQIQRLFYLPVLILVLFAAAALPLFDPWPVSRPVLLFGGVVTTALVLQAWRLDYTARAIQRNLLEVLSARKASIEHMPIDKTLKDRMLATLSYASHTIRSEHEGAFLPLTALPLVRIIIVTVGALGLILSQAIFGVGFSL